MKKAETKKFIAVIDPMAIAKANFEFKELNAKNLIEAMNEAKNLMSENVYLVNIFEKQAGGDKEKVFYNKVLTNRGNGWHTNEEGESEATIAFYYKWHDASWALNSTDFEWVY